MPQHTEPELIAKACLGDQQAFRSLVDSHKRLVYSIAFRFTRNDAETEDLAQECFIRLWKNLDRFNPEHKLKNWLGKMITNICLDYIKSVKNRNKMNTQGIEKNLEVVDSNHHEKELHASELHNIILKLADNLTPKQKAAFILRDLEMMDVNDVCELLNESAENLKSNLYYARKYIRENLLKYYKTSLA